MAEGRVAGTRPGKGTWTLQRGYLLVLVVPGAALCIFFFWPLLLVVERGFFEPAFSLDAFRALFARSHYTKVLLYTFEVATTVTLLCLIISYPVAALVARARGTMLHICLALILIPFWTSVVIRSYAWMVLFQRKGILNRVLIDLDLIDSPVKLMHNNIGVHIGMVQILMPFMILPLLGALRNMDTTLLRAAEVLGANPIRTFIHVYLPLSMPGVSAGVALVFITSLGFFVTPALLGGERNMMVSVLIQWEVQRLLNWPVASALATLLLIATIGFYFLYERFSRKAGGAGVLG
jgi:putative spermidine/putrescine transport system permease protein/mannopine transport system permease protein